MVGSVSPVQQHHRRLASMENLQLAGPEVKADRGLIKFTLLLIADHILGHVFDFSFCDV